MPQGGGKRARAGGEELPAAVPRPEAWGWELAEDPIQLSQALLQEPVNKAPRKSATPWRNLGRRQERRKEAAQEDLPLIVRCLRRGAMVAEAPPAPAAPAAEGSRAGLPAGRAPAPPAAAAAPAGSASAQLAKLLVRNRPAAALLAAGPSARPPQQPVAPLPARWAPPAGSQRPPAGAPAAAATTPLWELAGRGNGARDLSGQPGESVATRTMTLQQGAAVCQWVLWAGAAERWGPQLEGRRVRVFGARVQEIMGALQLKGCTRVEVCEAPGHEGGPGGEPQG
ncbi:unnamed protein product [Prorocentrum cordatum]|uniref:Uncharacterized protein n=1 Tax=Prorocentrum cordatum TaxID=2364126 RepID=A0ABN9U3F7_9DINO|nr:unnamed protein product [Polarella glacialis]